MPTVVIERAGFDVNVTSVYRFLRGYRVSSINNPVRIEQCVEACARGGALVDPPPLRYSVNGVLARDFVVCMETEEEAQRLVRERTAMPLGMNLVTLKVRPR